MGRITFAYDAAGNRIKRELIIPKKNKAQGNTNDVKVNYYDSLGGKDMTLTSDASGIVQISINDFDERYTVYLSVYSINGIRVIDTAFEEACLSIDLSSYPTGVYILCVRINENQTTWKIHKK